MRRWWPWVGRESWSGECQRIHDDPQGDGHYERDPNRAFTRPLGQRWCNQRAQVKGEWYRIHISKPRMVSRVRFNHGADNGAFPKRYVVRIQEREGASWVEINEFSGPIDVPFAPPRKILRFEVAIVEPYLDEKGVPYGWSIYDIEVTEVLLFGRMFHRVIPE